MNIEQTKILNPKQTSLTNIFNKQGRDLKAHERIKAAHK